jgi:hypothetical protein
MAKEKYTIELNLTSDDGMTFHGGASMTRNYGDGTGSTTGCSGGEYKSLADITRTLKNIVPNSMLTGKKHKPKKK